MSYNRGLDRDKDGIACEKAYERPAGIVASNHCSATTPPAHISMNRSHCYAIVATVFLTTCGAATSSSTIARARTEMAKSLTMTSLLYV
jgi:hypothetical protein